jgi:hypothetical protein
MRNVDYQTLTEQEAREMLERIIERAEQLNETTREFINAFAVRAETFVAVLRANPDIVAWQKNMRTLQYRPEFVASNGTRYVVSITPMAMNNPHWRAQAGTELMQ